MTNTSPIRLDALTGKLFAVWVSGMKPERTSMVTVRFNLLRRENVTAPWVSGAEYRLWVGPDVDETRDALLWNVVYDLAAGNVPPAAQHTLYGVFVVLLSREPGLRAWVRENVPEWARVADGFLTMLEKP